MRLKEIIILCTLIISNDVVAQLGDVVVNSNYDYEVLTKPDKILVWDDLERMPNGQKFYEIEWPNGGLDTLFLRGDGNFFFFNSDREIKYSIYPYGLADVTLNDIGIPSRSEFAEIRVMEIIQGGINGLIFEFTEYYFSKYPGQLYNYQLQIFEDGEWRICYGPNTMQESFPAYSEIATQIVAVDVRTNDLLQGVYVGGENTDLRVYDYFESPFDPDTISFDSFPGEGLLVSYSVSRVNGISKESLSRDKELQIVSGGVVFFTDVDYVEVTDITGRKVLSKSKIKRQDFIELDLEQNTYCIIKWKKKGQVGVYKLFLRK